MDQQGFKGTLLLLQNRTKKDPEGYRDDFLAQRSHFDAMVESISSSFTPSSLPSKQFKNPQFLAVMSYVCHVSHCYPEECSSLSDQLISILRKNKTIMDSDTRMAFVQNVMLLRSKDLVSPTVTLPFFFDLLQLRDKALRKVILGHIVSDIRRINLPGRKNAAAVNKAVQNYLFSVVAEDDSVQARRAALVTIDLYRRGVWCNDRTVEVLAECCFSRHTQIMRTALHFFMMQMPKVSSIDDSDDEGEEKDPGREVSRLNSKHKIVKKTKKRARILKRERKQQINRYDKTQKEEYELAHTEVDPVRLLRDPHRFVERLFARLQRTSERFEVRILFLSVISRVVSEHNVVLLPLYGFLERYTEPSQLHVTQLLALSAACVHSMVPPDAVEPLVRAIANHFVRDRSDSDSITIGINTIREICKRQPGAMTEPLLADLIAYKSQRGDRGVVMAARALLQLFRDVRPELLPARMRGTSSTLMARNAARRAEKDPAEVAGAGSGFGAPAPLLDIPGMELLQQHYGEDADGSTKMGDSDEDDMEEDDDSAYESFETESEGSFSSATTELSDRDLDFEGEDVGKMEEPPMLVSGRGAAQEKEKSSHSDEGKNGEDKDMSQSGEEGESSSEADSEFNPDEWVLDDGNDSSEDEEDDEELEEEEGEEDANEEEGEEQEADEEKKMESKRPKEQASSQGDEPPALEPIDSKPDALTDKALAFFLVEDKRQRYPSDASGTPSAYSVAYSASIRAAENSASLRDAASLASSTGQSVAAVRLFTDEDFAKLRTLRRNEILNASGGLGGRQKVVNERLRKKDKLIYDVSSNLTGEDIEAFTESKRSRDKEERIAKAVELRSAKQPFNILKKKKSKQNSTHAEHSKRGKLFQMVRRSQRVAKKIKSSINERGKKSKENKKKDIKFRIKRGWKA